MPAITVAIPAYNRPEGLQNAIKSVLSQSFTNFTVLISDNASTDMRVCNIIETFKRIDFRVQSVRQSENIGPFKNFIYLAEKTETTLLIFLADDDLWPPHHLETLNSCMTTDTLMVFPDADLICSNPARRKCSVLKKKYRKCNTDDDYLKAWCADGSGQPFYGLYNLKQMRSRGLDFEFMEDLTYFNEGLFLHKLFLAGSIRFAPQTSVQYKADSAIRSREELAIAFISYTERVIKHYLNAYRPPGSNRDAILETLICHYTSYLLSLCREKKSRFPYLKLLSMAARSVLNRN
jgi:glycosyltransferase involved in cell wall biosynthesis